MNRPVTLDQLDQMAAEVLPERTVLSVALSAGGGGTGGGIALSGCMSSNTYTNPGVLGLLAPQLQSGPIQTMSCVPGAVATY